MKKVKKIFWDLYKANSQQEVSDVINKYSELKDQKTGYLMVVTKVILEHSKANKTILFQH
jgi:ribosome-binding factor A